MNMLESPLEALAFNYVSFGIFTVVNNLWTWVAVITAAISFWRIKTQVTPTLQTRNDRNTSGSQPVPEISPDESCTRVEPTAPAPAPAPAIATASHSVCDVEDVDGVTKGKFMLYYCEEEKEVYGGITAVKVWQDNFSDGECGEWWERMTRVKRGEMGWYGYQDLTVVNGNIVRLWDECRREKYYSSCCVVW